jgi:hypothetical protein
MWERLKGLIGYYPEEYEYLGEFQTVLICRCRTVFDLSHVVLLGNRGPRYNSEPVVNCPFCGKELDKNTKKLTGYWIMKYTRRFGKDSEGTRARFVEIAD